MPWFPDFVNALELAHLQTRAVGRLDPVVQYVEAIQGGDTRPLETVWPGSVVVYDPRAGRVSDHKRLRAFGKLTEALRELVNSRETRRRMGTCARARAEEFTMDEVAGQWEVCSTCCSSAVGPGHDQCLHIRNCKGSKSRGGCLGSRCVANSRRWLDNGRCSTRRRAEPSGR